MFAAFHEASRFAEQFFVCRKTQEDLIYSNEVLYRQHGSCRCKAADVQIL